MRVLFTTTGHVSHVLPLLPFARACQLAGHEVCVASQRSRGELIRRAGLRFLAFDDPPETEWAPIMASLPHLTPDEANARVIGEIFARIDTRAALPGVLDILKTWRPHVIVRENSEFAGALAADAFGIPHVRVGLGLAATEEWVLELAAAALDGLRAELDLSPDPDGRRIRSTPYLTLTPSALEDPAVPGPPETHRFRDNEATAAESLPDWWPGNDDPLVYVTFGSVAATVGYFPRLYRATIDALAELPARVLVTTGHAADPAHLGPPPPNTRVERWIAQDLVARHAAAIICHGGYGSTLGALRRGLPPILVPLFAGDQWQTARRVAHIGAGIVLPCHPEPGRRALDPPSPQVIAALPDAVQSVLKNPDYRSSAGRLAHAIAALPPADAAVDTLRMLAARPPPIDA